MHAGSRTTPARFCALTVGYIAARFMVARGVTSINHSGLMILCLHDGLACFDDSIYRVEQNLFVKFDCCYRNAFVTRFAIVCVINAR